MIAMTAPKLRVLISGGGIAGPCLAYWLARTRLNISVTIVERSPVPRATGQSIDIRGAAIQIIKDMQLEPDIRARYTTEEGTRFVNSSGKAFAQFDAGDSFTADYEILRADLSELFLEATEKLSSVQYKYGDSVASLDESDTGVDVTFTSGSKDTFDLLVAADGSASKTRAMFLSKEILQNSYNFLGQYIAFFSIPSQPHDEKQWFWYCVPKGLCIMTRPHRNQTTKGAYLAVTMPAHGIQDPIYESAIDTGIDASKRALRQSFQNVGWRASEVLDGMDKSTDFYITRAAQVRLPKWTSPRCVVLGDAAFATFGIGTTLAIESAYVLAGELSKIQQTDTSNGSAEIPQTLERYEQTFRPIYAKSEDKLPGFPQFVFPQTRWALWLRDTFLWIVSRTKVHQLFMMGPDKDWLRMPVYDWVVADEKKR